MKVKVINKSNFDLPEYKTSGSVGLDVKANIEDAITLEPLERVLVPTGLYLEIPEGYECQARARSGLSIKHGITLVNGVGTIDTDYRGEIKIPLVNLSNSSYTISNGDRVAQLVFAKFQKIEWEKAEMIQETFRGVGGFGSTGK